jgi:hypothetical protein
MLAVTQFMNSSNDIPRQLVGVRLFIRRMRGQTFDGM